MTPRKRFTIALSFYCTVSLAVPQAKNRPLPPRKSNIPDFFDPLKKLRGMNAVPSLSIIKAGGQPTPTPSTTDFSTVVTPETKTNAGTVSVGRGGSGTTNNDTFGVKGAPPGGSAIPPQPKVDDKAVVDEKANASGKKPGPGGAQANNGGAPPSQSGIEIPSKFWPTCFFIDASMSQEQGNAIVKGVVDMAAKCGVAILAYPVTVQSFVDSHDWINERQRKACNVIDAGIAKTASTTSMVPFETTAGFMCGDDPSKPEEAKKTAGCAELQAGGGGAVKASSGMKAAASGSPAVSIEVIKGWSAGVVAHETHGHSQMGLPNHTPPTTDHAGNGIGKPKNSSALENNWSFGLAMLDPLQMLQEDLLFAPLPPPTVEVVVAAAEVARNGPPDKAGGGWDPGIGCPVMFENAHDNSAGYGYDPNRQTYYIKEEDPSLQYDFASAQPLFGPPAPPPAPGTASVTMLRPGPTGGGGTPGSTAEKGGTVATINVGQGQQSSNQTALEVPETAVKPGIGAGHVDKADGKKPISLSDLRRDSAGQGPPPEPEAGEVAYTKFSKGSNSPGSSGSKKVMVDENAPAVSAGAPASGGASGSNSGVNFVNAGVGSSSTVVAGGGGGSGGPKAVVDENGSELAPTASLGRGPSSLFLPIPGRGSGAGQRKPSAFDGDDGSEIFNSVGKEAAENNGRRAPGAALRGGGRGRSGGRQ